MPARVADASVIEALIFGEPRASEAAGFLHDAGLYAPSLLPYELASIARTKIRRHPEQRTLIELALKAGLLTDIRLVDAPQLAVLQVALETDLTTSDASYPYLARNLGTPIATFDTQRLGASRTE